MENLKWVHHKFTVNHKQVHSKQVFNMELHNMMLKTPPLENLNMENHNINMEILIMANLKVEIKIYRLLNMHFQKEDH